MAEENEIKVSVSGDGGEVSAKGESARQVIDALAGFVSPAVQASGLLGDMIRLYRQKNVIRGIHRAQELARELNVPISPVPPKFLVNWVEGISLEDSDDDENRLVDLWAGLLVSSGQGVKPSHHYFRRLLTELTSEHADLLNLISGAKNYTFSKKIFEDHDAKAAESIANPVLSLSSEEVERNNLVSFSNSLVGPGFQLVNVGFFEFQLDVATSNDLVWYEENKDLEFFISNHVLTMLIESGIIKRLVRNLYIDCPEKYEPPGRYMALDGFKAQLTIEVLVLTPLGVDFVLACRGDRA